MQPGIHETLSPRGRLGVGSDDTIHLSEILGQERLLQSDSPPMQCENDFHGVCKSEVSDGRVSECQSRAKMSCSIFEIIIVVSLLHILFSSQASGVQVADEVCRIFYDMKVRKCSTPEEIKKRKKAVIFCLSADKKCIVVEEGKEILVGDVGDTITDPFKHFVGMLPEKDCRYALYDASFETKESRKEELMFFLW